MTPASTLPTVRETSILARQSSVASDSPMRSCRDNRELVWSAVVGDGESGLNGLLNQGLESCCAGS